MQTIDLIKQLTSRVATASRQRRNERLCSALTRELALANPRLRAEIQQLITQATSGATPAATACASKSSTPMVSAARMPGGLRATPLPGLPTHLRYATS